MMADHRQYLRVKNWTKFQHYKKRNPPWIRLQTALLDDKDFQQLPDASRALAPCIWLLAARSQKDDPKLHGCIPYDLTEIAWKLRREEPWVSKAIQPLIDKGFFIIFREDASNVLASSEQSASAKSLVGSSETETETETETDSKKLVSAASRKKNKRGEIVTEADLKEFETDPIHAPLQTINIRIEASSAANWAKDNDVLFTRGFLHNWLKRHAAKAAKARVSGWCPSTGKCDVRIKRPGQRYLTECGGAIYTPQENEPRPPGMLRHCIMHYRRWQREQTPTVKQENPNHDQQPTTTPSIAV
jgi:hypothetical protein